MDDDCDGTVDLGPDGESVCIGPCDDVAGVDEPGLEVCDDGLDNDCDGMPDTEDPECLSGGCTDCASTVSGGASVTPLLTPFLLGIARRRRRVHT